MLIVNIINVVMIIVLVAYAAYCNAVMDTVSDFDDVHFNASIFSNKDSLWYNKNKSWVLKHDKALWLQHLPNNLKWLKKLPFSDSISDNWHWSKSKMLFSLAMTTILATFLQLSLNDYWVLPIIFIIWGIAWIQTFNIYFNKKLKK